MVSISAQDDPRLVTFRDVYAEMVAAGTAYCQSTAVKAMQRIRPLPRTHRTNAGTGRIGRSPRQRSWLAQRRSPTVKVDMFIAALRAGLWPLV